MDSMVEDHIEIVKNLINALEVNDFEQAEGYLADDFIFTGWTPQPLQKENFIIVMSELKEGMPGLMFNVHNLQMTEYEGNVKGILKVTGYQTGSFNLPQLSLPPIPQTGHSITLPTEEVLFVVRDGKLHLFEVHPVPGGGIHGLINQLGIEIPGW